MPLRASLETLGNVGVGALVVAAMLTLTALTRPSVRRAATGVLSPVTAMGAMPLSIYTIHLVVIALAIREENGVVTDDSWPLLIALVVGSMAFAWPWRRYLGRGPLERVLRVRAAAIERMPHRRPHPAELAPGLNPHFGGDLEDGLSNDGASGVA